MKDIQKAVVVFLLPDKASKYSTTKYSSECVLCFYTKFFHIISLLLDTTLPVVSKFFEPTALELFRLSCNHFPIIA